MKGRVNGEVHELPISAIKRAQAQAMFALEQQRGLVDTLLSEGKPVDGEDRRGQELERLAFISSLVTDVFGG